MENKNFDYLPESEKQNDDENQLFLRLPFVLIKDERLKGLTDAAKILYSLFLHRTSVSRKNGWVDGDNKIYIIYPISEIAQDLNCWEQKAQKILRELKEIGLVKVTKKGSNQPNLIYIKMLKRKKSEEQEEAPAPAEKPLEDENPAQGC